MKKPLSDDLDTALRGLIRTAENPLWAIRHNNRPQDHLYEAMEALRYIAKLKELLGYKQPEGTTLKQIEIPY